MSDESDLLTKINKVSLPIRIMHVCGTHERTISRYGMRDVLPSEIEVLSGPGCPVCVTTEREIDIAIELAMSGVILTSFGDMMRVPGSCGSLIEARSQGADVRMVYSIDDAITIAENNPKSKVVFFAIGFETTAPINAAAILRDLPENFSLFVSHKLTPPAVLALIDEINIDAFIAPGHVCTIVGIHPYQQFADMGFPVVAAGFEAKDVLLSISMILEQMMSGDTIVENGYPRAVRNEGNTRAQEMMEQVFDISDAQWRGLGTIKGSGLSIRNEFADHDAALIFEDIIDKQVRDVSYDNVDTSLCRCANILKGREKPNDCALFGKRCTPETPVGSCMVSQEGMCHNWYRYRGL